MFYLNKKCGIKLPTNAGQVAAAPPVTSSVQVCPCEQSPAVPQLQEPTVAVTSPAVHSKNIMFNNKIEIFLIISLHKVAFLMFGPLFYLNKKCGIKLPTNAGQVAAAPPVTSSVQVCPCEQSPAVPQLQEPTVAVTSPAVHSKNIMFNNKIEIFLINSIHKVAFLMFGCFI